jgi:diguanylate cyclase (GGDEF)-like protein
MRPRVADGWPGVAPRARARSGPSTGVPGRWRLNRLPGLALAAAPLAAIVWFAAGPDRGQVVALRLITTVLCGATAVGQWQLSREDGMSPPSARFWRILATGLFAFAAGMAVDLAVTLCGGALAAFSDVGTLGLYPVAALLVLIALVMFPAPPRNRVERITITLDAATVLLACAIFVWYFLAAPRLTRSGDFHGLPNSTVLPALTLVAAFALLRIMLDGAQVVRRSVVACFAAAAAIETVTIAIQAPAVTTLGRFSSVLQTAGLAICVLGVGRQRRHQPAPTPAAAAAAAVWRPFVILPFGAVVASLALLLMISSADLDRRNLVVGFGAFGLCTIVMARQLISLWENARLLAVNRALTQRLEHKAYHDDLTGLANRTLLIEHVTRALAHPDGTVSVLFFDLDDFKFVNDSLGHHAGDELLIAVAQRLTLTIGADETFGRLGGDEFAILVRSHEPHAALATAERIAATMRQPFQLSMATVRTTVSIGVATAPGGKCETPELLRNADIAMYVAKKSHKGGWRLFAPTMLEDLLHRHRTRAALALAVEQNEFVVHYQPIINLVDGTVHGAEALVRWRRPCGDLVLPDQFIPLAEETGLVSEIDRLVLVEACHQAARWLARLSDDNGFTIHVNLSARQLHRPELISDVGNALRDSGVPAERLTLEITESGLCTDHATAIRQLDKLTDLGVHLAIDDFGTGYSSLSYLRSMPVDVLKIDKSFTAELLDTDGTAPLAQAVIALATALSMQTVAEGIEDPAQASRLLDLGCRHGQGFHYAKALPPDQMGTLLGITDRGHP